mmetsp:Transcript_43113/g.119248  ORF Transcript_43113/g.119248 Transcript_43113/m.119248 type:complete len:215 (-) Transcript_43113:483-1127(-)
MYEACNRGGAEDTIAMAPACQRSCKPRRTSISDVPRILASAILATARARGNAIVRSAAARECAHTHAATTLAVVVTNAAILGAKRRCAQELPIAEALRIPFDHRKMRREAMPAAAAVEAQERIFHDFRVVVVVGVAIALSRADVATSANRHTVIRSTTRPASLVAHATTNLLEREARAQIAPAVIAAVRSTLNAAALIGLQATEIGRRGATDAA